MSLSLIDTRGQASPTNAKWMAHHAECSAWAKKNKNKTKFTGHHLCTACHEKILKLSDCNWLKSANSPAFTMASISRMVMSPLYRDTLSAKEKDCCSSSSVAVG